MKTLKLVQLAGIAVLLLGVIIRAGAGEYYGTALALLGLAVYAGARLTAWVKTDKEF